VRMTATLVEIHVPFGGEEPAPEWIDRVEEHLVGAEGRGELEVYDDGEEFGDVYVFFVTGASEDDLLSAAAEVATLPGVPPGAFAHVSDVDAGQFGLGRRIELDLV
jgi:hypothetical protein